MEARSRPIFRLRGDLEGAEQILDLQAGTHEVGSARTNAIIFPHPSVSRRHARLSVREGLLEIEDLGSTNGTLVDGERVRSGEVSVGSELRFGLVRLVVEEADEEDSELAISLETSPRPAPGAEEGSRFTPEESTVRLPPDTPALAGVWLEWVAGFVAEAHRDPAEGLGRALAWLGTSLELEGCCALRFDEGEAVSLGAWGTVSRLPPERELGELCGMARGEAGSDVIYFLQSEPPTALAATGGESGRPRVGLALWGDFPERLASTPLLQTLAGAVARLLPRLSGRGEDAAEVRELVFPEGFQPGSSPAMLELYRQMHPLLRGDLPVLISGETGVGKERVARILHGSSERRGGPFVAVNCAAIPAELLEAEMFGIGKGVATGVDARQGKFEQAEGGTLFLDEVGEMSRDLQAKLLRTLQEGEIQPVGSRPKRIDVRILSATNVELGPEEPDPRLRPDLYYRLAGFQLEVPPLRRTRQDIPGLVEHFLHRYARQSGIAVRGLTIAALKRLAAYPWPGNVRELENEVRRLVYSSGPDRVIRLADLSRRLAPGEQDGADPGEYRLGHLESLALEPNLAVFEASLIREALERAGGKKVEACRLLGLSRNGLRKKMQRLGIPP